jgi:hypothetical protein
MRQRAPEDDIYLIWSQQAGAWWGPDANGYVGRLAEAGRYHRHTALRLCAGAVLSAKAGTLPELPVRLVDVIGAITAYETMTGNMSWAHWQ